MPPIATTIVGATTENVRGVGSCLFGRARYRAGGSCGARVQKHFQLVVLLRGTMSLRLDDSSLIIAAGQGILLAPSGHEMLRFPQGGIHTWCQVQPSFLSPSDRRLLHSCRGVHPVSPAIHRIIDEAISSPAPSGPADQVALLALARACLLRFAADVLRHATPPIHPALERALRLLSDSAASISSATDLARRSGLSLSRLRQLFRDAGHPSPSALLWQLKAERAVRLIASTGLSLAEICDQCGYANPFHLSRSVKQRTGLSPRSLRRLHWSPQ